MESSSLSLQGTTVSAGEAVTELRLPGGMTPQQIIGVGIALVFGFGAALVTLSLALNGDKSGSWILFALVGGPSLVALALYAPQVSRRQRGGSLRVTPGALVIDHPAILREPLEIPLNTIRKAVIDDGSGWDGGKRLRFRVHDRSSDDPDSRQPSGALWERPSRIRAQLPSIDVIPWRAPNVALLFEPRVTAPKLRDPGVFGPQKGEEMIGAVLRTEDPAAARAALSSLVKIAHVDQDDLDYVHQGLGSSGLGSSPSANGGIRARHVGAPSTEGDRARLVMVRQIRAGWLALVLGVLIPAIALVAAVIGVLLTSNASGRRWGIFFLVAGIGIFALRLYLYKS